MSDQSKNLTSRQKEILSLLRRGLTNAEICRALNISANTVKVHLANIYKILDVTNRTEAAYMDPEEVGSRPAEDNEIRVTFVGGESLDKCPSAKTLFLSIEESLNRYRLFSINEKDDTQSPSKYQIKFSGALNKDEALFVTLYKGTNSEIIWSESLQACSIDDLQRVGTQVAVQLFRHIFHSAAQTYEQDKEASPRWWYASCFANVKMENISRESFEAIFQVQADLVVPGG